MKEVLRAFRWPLKGLHLSVLITKPLLAIKSISLQFLPLVQSNKNAVGSVSVKYLVKFQAYYKRVLPPTLHYFGKKWLQFGCEQ